MRARFLLVFLYASILHATWAVMLLFNTDADGATALSGITRALPGPETTDAMVMLVSSGLAAWVILGPRPIPPLWTLGLIPQQMLLTLAAWAALSAIVAGHFADGAERPTIFIAADQFPILLTAALHNIVIVAFEQQQFRGTGIWPWKR